MHYIRELVHDRTIVLQYRPTDEQVADIFTKKFTEKKVCLPPVIPKVEPRLQGFKLKEIFFKHINQ